MHFPIGSRVKLASYTGDDQIDFYFGHDLTVLEYREIKYFDVVRIGDSPIGHIVWKHIPNYSLLAPDNVVITANEYELEAE